MLITILDRFDPKFSEVHYISSSDSVVIKRATERVLGDWMAETDHTEWNWPYCYIINQDGEPIDIRAKIEPNRNGE